MGYSTGGLVWILGKKFFMERLVKLWNRMPGAVIETPAVAPGDMGDWWAWQCFGEWLTQ